MTWESEPALAGPCEEPEVVGCGDNNGDCDDGKVCDDTSGKFKKSSNLMNHYFLLI